MTRLKKDGSPDRRYGGGMKDSPTLVRRKRKTVETLTPDDERQYATGGLGTKGDPEMASEMVLRGVTLNWISQVFGIPHGKVKHLLKDAPILKRHQNGAIYDVKVVAPYLVEPRVDIEAYFHKMKIDELPTRLQDSFWSAMRKKQSWEEDAGHLWRTEKVAAAFGEVFLLVKESISLFVQNLEASTEITPRQEKLLEEMCFALLTEISAKVKKLKMRRPEEKTVSTLGEELRAREAEQVPAKAPQPENEDEDYMSVI